jgi:hypothetical protein
MPKQTKSAEFIIREKIMSDVTDQYVVVWEKRAAGDQYSYIKSALGPQGWLVQQKSLFQGCHR